MSWTECFWKQAHGDPSEVEGQLLEDEDVTGVRPSDDVVSFRRDVLTAWPELADDVAPWAADLDWRQPWGRTGLERYYLAVTLRGDRGAEIAPALADLARRYGLVNAAEAAAAVDLGPDRVELRGGLAPVSSLFDLIGVRRKTAVRIARVVSEHSGTDLLPLIEWLGLGAVAQLADEPQVTLGDEALLAMWAEILQRLTASPDGDDLSAQACGDEWIVGTFVEVRDWSPQGPGAIHSIPLDNLVPFLRQHVA